MIVDDRRVICGSANINDRLMCGEPKFWFSDKIARSQKGNGDSEIALVVDDTDMIDSRMNGEPVSNISRLREEMLSVTVSSDTICNIVT